MPEMDGLKAARIIRESTSLQQPPKIILITAYGNELGERSGRAGRACSVFSSNRSAIRSLFDNVMHAFIEVTPEAAKPAVRRRRSIGRGLHRSPRAAGWKTTRSIRELASQLLRDAGIIVSLAENGREAVEKVTTESFDGVLDGHPNA